MCGEPSTPDHEETRGLSRRQFIGAAGLALGAGWLAGPAGLRVPAAQASAIDGSPAVSMAMHIHSSFSEAAGSIDSHAFQAATNAVQVLWLTDHDHRMRALRYRNVVHFTSLTGEKTDGGAWAWQQRKTGSLASSSGGVVSSPHSPNDPVAAGSLAVSAQNAGSAPASLGYYASASNANLNYKGNLYGQSLTIDVLPTSISGTGYLELLIGSSYHQAAGGRTAGEYSISYRFGGPGQPGDRVTNGRQGIVYVGVTPGTWSPVTVTPSDDIAALWPDMVAGDFASAAITLSAVSTGSRASGNFDYLRFTRQYVSGDIPLQTQRDMIDAYGPRYPTVNIYQGLELSYAQPHVNTFGPGLSLANLSAMAGSDYPGYLQQQVAEVHAAGGVASYNHPFGTTTPAIGMTATQDALVRQAATTLLANNLYGCDVIEVGYASRGGCDVAHHVALWDVLSRNGRFLTGNGVSDDHAGINWAGLTNNWFTSVWAPGAAQPDLLDALRAGRAWTASLSRFRGALDLVADGSAPMGSVSVSQVAQRQVQVMATAVPTGGKVEVIRGDCDFTGTSSTATVVATIPAGAITSGSVSVPVDTGTACFVRTQVVDSTGRVVGLSNPVWLLRQIPAGGIPAARAY